MSEKSILECKADTENKSFMSVENVICKDDNSGEAAVFIENGTPSVSFCLEY